MCVCVPHNHTGYYEEDIAQGRAPDCHWEGGNCHPRPELREDVLLHNQLPVLTLVSVFLPSPCYRSDTQAVIQRCAGASLRGHNCTHQCLRSVVVTNSTYQGAKP